MRLAEFGHRNDSDSFQGECRLKVVQPKTVLGRLQRDDASLHLSERLGWSPPIGESVSDSRRHSLERRHSDCEKLVQVGGHDGEKLDPLEQRQIVGCELEDTSIEVEPREVPVEVPAGSDWCRFRPSRLPDESISGCRRPVRHISSSAS
jgi:hypothetical protein